MTCKPILTSLLMTVLCLGAAMPAHAAGTAMDDRGDDEFFGRLTITSAMKPEFIHAKPVQVHGHGAGATATPLVLHVREGEEERWAARCQVYTACDVPVRFVTEGWFKSVYLAEVGEQDDREQRYHDLVRSPRESHAHRCSETIEAAAPQARQH